MKSSDCVQKPCARAQKWWAHGDVGLPLFLKTVAKPRGFRTEFSKTRFDSVRTFFNTVSILFPFCFNTVSKLFQYCFQCCFNAVSMLFQCCFNTVSILFQYCFNTVSMLFLTISDYLQPAAYRLQAAACRLQPAGCKLQPAACSLQATPWALKGPEYAKTYHFLMILATPTP